MSTNVRAIVGRIAAEEWSLFRSGFEIRASGRFCIDAAIAEQFIRIELPPMITRCCCYR